MKILILAAIILNIKAISASEKTEYEETFNKLQKSIKSEAEYHYLAFSHDGCASCERRELEDRYFTMTRRVKHELLDYKISYKKEYSRKYGNYYKSPKFHHKEVKITIESFLLRAGLSHEENIFLIQRCSEIESILTTTETSPKYIFCDTSVCKNLLADFKYFLNDLKELNSSLVNIITDENENNSPNTPEMAWKIAREKNGLK